MTPAETLARLEKRFKNHPKKRFKIAFHADVQAKYWAEVKKLNAQKQTHETK